MQGGIVRSPPKSLRAVVARIPWDTGELEQRFERDEHFQAVCRDFAEAFEALDRWQRTAGEDDRRAMDYKRLLEELELELIALLQTTESRP